MCQRLTNHFSFVLPSVKDPCCRLLKAFLRRFVPLYSICWLIIFLSELPEAILEQNHSFPLASSSVFCDDCAEGAFCSSAVLHSCSFLQPHLILLFPNISIIRLLLIQTSFVGMIYMQDINRFFAVVAKYLLYELAYVSQKLPSRSKPVP